MAAAGPKSGYKGVARKCSKWQPQIFYRGKMFYLPTTERPEDAARWFDRAAYKLLGRSEGLNFPLSDEAKAELDAISVAEFLAEVQVEKDKTQWAGTTTGGTSRYYGVSACKASKTWKVQVQGRIVAGFRSEKSAADMVDEILVEFHGPRAMTNAKYYSGEEGREQAWQELKEKYRQDIEAGTDVSGRNANASQRGQKAATRTNRAKATQCRAKPKGRRKRKDSSSEDGDDVALSSDEEDQWQSSSEDSSSEDLDLADSGSNDASLSSAADPQDTGRSDESEEDGAAGDASCASGSVSSSASEDSSDSGDSEDSADTGSDSESSESSKSGKGQGSSAAASSFGSEDSATAEVSSSDNSEPPLTPFEASLHIRGQVPHCRYYQGPAPAAADEEQEAPDESVAWGLDKDPEVDLRSMFPLTFSRTGRSQETAHEEDRGEPNPKWQHQTEGGKLRYRLAKLQSLERLLGNLAMLADLGLVERPAGMTDLQLLKKYNISPELVLPHKRESIMAEIAKEAAAARAQAEGDGMAKGKAGNDAEGMGGIDKGNLLAASSGGTGGVVNTETAAGNVKTAATDAGNAGITAGGNASSKAGGSSWEATGVRAGVFLKGPWLGQPCTSGTADHSGKKGWGFDGSYAAWQAELERFDRWTGTKTDLEWRAAGFKSGKYEGENGGLTGFEAGKCDGAGSQPVERHGSKASDGSGSVLERAEEMVHMGRAALGKYFKVRSDLALDMLEEFLGECQSARLKEMDEAYLEDEDEDVSSTDEAEDDVSRGSHGQSEGTAGPKLADRRKVQEVGAKMLEVGRASLVHFYGGKRTIGMDLLDECLRGHKAGVDYGIPGRLYSLVQELKYSEDDYVVPGAPKKSAQGVDASTPADDPAREADGEYLELAYGPAAAAGGYGSLRASAELAEDFAVICNTVFGGQHSLGAGPAAPGTAKPQASLVPEYINADDPAVEGLLGPEALLERMREMIDGSTNPAKLKPHLVSAWTAPAPATTPDPAYANPNWDATINPRPSATCTDGGGAAAGARAGTAPGASLWGPTGVSGLSTKDLAARLKAKMFGRNTTSHKCNHSTGASASFTCSCPVAQASNPTCAAAAAATGHAACAASPFHAGPAVCPLGARTSRMPTPNDHTPAGPYIPVSVALASQGRPSYLDKPAFAGKGSMLGKRGADGGIKEPPQQHGSGWRSKPPAPAPPRRRPLLGVVPVVRNSGI